MGERQVITLWPGGAPDPIPGVGPEAWFRMPSGPGAEVDWVRNVSEPTLTVVPADPGRANGTGVIVCPGGGWRILAWGHEGADAAEWFAARGVTAFILKYRLNATPDDPAAFDKLNQESLALEGKLGRLPGAQAPRTLNELTRGNDKVARAKAAAATDGRRALAVVRERAAEFGLDPARVGMIGFSAGAFLTADVAMEPGGAPLAFAAPIYGGETGGRPVPADAPPLFTCIAQDDRMLFRVVEGMFADWSDADRPAELHLFQKGGHGFGMIEQGLPADSWTALLERWLQDLGCL